MYRNQSAHSLLHKTQSSPINHKWFKSNLRNIFGAIEKHPKNSLLVFFFAHLHLASHTISCSMNMRSHDRSVLNIKILFACLHRSLDFNKSPSTPTLCVEQQRRFIHLKCLSVSVFQIKFMFIDWMLFWDEACGLRIISGCDLNRWKV